MALRFLAEVEGATALVAEAPGRWQRAGHGTRRLPLQKFPYDVMYRERESDVEIVAIAHQARRPGYWRRR